METVVNAILIRHGEVLLGRRSPTRSSYPDCWSLPGGHLEEGERLDQALVREVQEELGVTPVTYRSHATLLETSPFSGKPVTYHLFVVEEWEGNPTVRDDEHTELRWFPISVACEVEDIAIGKYRTVLRSLAEDDGSKAEQDDEILTTRVLNILRRDSHFQLMLAAVRQASLPHAAIGAGAIRNRVWNALHDIDPAEYSDEDVDVVFFDERDQSVASEQAAERWLGEMMPFVPWSVKNQARMHLANADSPYRDLEQAINHWLETPTAIAITAEDTPRLIAPYGVSDLLGLCVEPTPIGSRKLDLYRRRIETKRWLSKWPRLVIFWTRARRRQAPLI